MTVSRRRNLLWGLLALGVAVVVLLNASGLIPPGLLDALNRAWPALLVVFGLSLFLRGRAPFSGLIALLVGGLLVGVMAGVAYSSRAGQTRDDNHLSASQAIPAGLNLLRVRLETLSTDVEITRSLSDDGNATHEFIGSSESTIAFDYETGADNTATLTVRETVLSAFPMLEAMGRGRMRLELPAGVPLDVSFVGADGAVSLSMSGLSVERLNLDLGRGEALVTLPEYDPLASPDDATLGALVVRDGNLTLFVPQTVGARFELSGGGQPDYDANVYNLLASGAGVLESRSFDALAIKQRYTVTVPRGTVSLRLVG